MSLSSSRWAPARPSSSLKSTSTSSSTNAPGSLAKDIDLANPPSDSISALSFSPAATSNTNFLAVASWDNTVKIYDVASSLAGEGKAEVVFDRPVLDCAWSLDGQHVVGAGASCTAQLLSLSNPQTAPIPVASHSLPIRSVRFCTTPSSSGPLLATGSWDATLKFWDLRMSPSEQAAATLDMGEKVYSMDVQGELLLVACADSDIRIVDLKEPGRVREKRDCGLKHQVRVVRAWPDGKGWAVGGIEGRAAFGRSGTGDGVTAFKCHRTPSPSTSTTPNNPPTTDVFAINCISFHPTHHTFSTAGSDGTIHIWDKISKQRVKSFPSVGAPISATAFSADGGLLAYSVCYDWSKGFAYNSPEHVNKVVLHEVREEEVKGRVVKKTSFY